METAAPEPLAIDAQLDPASRELVERQLFLARLQERRPIVTYALLATIVALFGLEQLWGAGTTATLVRMGAEVPSRIRAGEWWRLLAPVFLHSGVAHVLMNGLVLWMLGPFVERLLGSARFLVLFGVSGLFGNLFGTWFSGSSKFGLSVGASGALFGLLGASAVLGLWPRGQIPPLIAGDLKKNALINFGLNFVASLRPNVDYLAHLGGAVAGILLVAIGLLRPTLSMSREAQSSRLSTWLLRGLAAICALSLYGSIGVALYKGGAWQLVQPLKFERQRIGQTGLSMDAPVLLGHPEIVKGDDGATEAVFGDGLQAPITLAVRTLPFHEAADDPEALRKLYESGAASFRDASPSGDMVRMGEAEEVTVQGLPALRMQFRYGSRGAILQRIFQVRPRYVATLEFFSLNDATTNMQLDLVQLLGSLHDDSQP